MKALSNSDATIRHSALAALGETIKPKDLHVLIAQYVNGKNGDDTAVAGKALRAACIRMADREACAAELAAAMPNASTASQHQSRRNPRRDGWPQGIGNDRRRRQGQRPETSGHGNQGTRQMDDRRCRAGAPRSRGRKIRCKYQDRALRGYIRLARQFSMPDAKRCPDMRQRSRRGQA